MAAATLNRILERGQGDDLAIDVPGGTRLTYRELREQVAAVADELSRMGLGRGDRIALVLPNCVEAIVLFVAAATVGTAAPLNPAYKEDEFRFYLEDVDARALVVPPGQAAAARRAIPSGAILVEASLDEAGSIRLESETPRDESRSAGGPADEDIALVLHTSGTTSRPKLVPLRQRNLFASARSIADTYRLAPDDVALCVIFADKAGHDAYQTDSLHEQFIARNKEHWQRVVVRDFIG